MLNGKWWNRTTFNCRFTFTEREAFIFLLVSTIPFFPWAVPIKKITKSLSHYVLIVGNEQLFTALSFSVRCPALSHISWSLSNTLSWVRIWTLHSVFQLTNSVLNCTLPFCHQDTNGDNRTWTYNITVNSRTFCRLNYIPKCTWRDLNSHVIINLKF